MTIEEFKASDGCAFTGALLALWLDGRGDWAQAHETAQEDGGADGAWVHAFLHRKDGDTVNAGYWYRRAGRPVVTGSLEAEWESMVRALLDARPEMRAQS